jgi:hypothetical protein
METGKGTPEYTDRNILFAFVINLRIPLKRIAGHFEKSRGILLSNYAWNKGVSIKEEY